MRAELSWRGRTGTVLVDGAPAAVLHRAPLRERAELDVAGHRWSLAARNNVLTASTPDGTVAHRAQGEGFWTKRWTVELGQATLRLRRQRSARRWQLLDGAGAAVGELRVHGAFRPTVVATLPDGTPANAAAFVLWMVDQFGRRQGAGAAMAAAGGATAASNG